MDLLPTLLRLQGRKCLVVGSNSSATQQASALLELGALVTVVAPENSEAKAPPGCDIKRRNFLNSDLDTCWLVVAASNSANENDTIRHACEARQLFCNVINDRDSSTFVSEPGNSNTTQQRSAGTAETLATTETAEGFVSLVGAGPGDPDLLTLRALKLIQTADVIVHDRLVSPQIIDLCRPDAEFIYAGKAKSNHAIPQDSINKLLVDLAQQKRQVVRLKGGDPFIFGRGGEEIETLSDHNIPFQVVPGVTAASGCAAFAGIPLTHRDHAQSCVFVTGHLKDGQINLNWQDLRDPTQTIVVYMGLTGVKVICESLIQHGRSDQTPAALIERGTTKSQRVLSGTLACLPDLVTNTTVVAPTLLIIGGVVSLRQKLKWFEDDGTWNQSPGN